MKPLNGMDDDMTRTSLQVSLLKAVTIGMMAILQVACSQSMRATQQESPPLTHEAKIAASVQKTLASPPTAGYAAIPAGTALLSARIEGNQILLDFNKALLQNGTGARLEDALRQITNPLGELTPHIKSPEYRVLIEGKPLAGFLP